MLNAEKWSGEEHFSNVSCLQINSLRNVLCVETGLRNKPKVKLEE